MLTMGTTSQSPGSVHDTPGYRHTHAPIAGETRSGCGARDSAGAEADIVIS